MKKFFLLFHLTGVVLLSAAQQTKQSVLYQLVEQQRKLPVPFRHLSLFRLSTKKEVPNNNVVLRYAKMELDKKAVDDAFKTKPETITVAIPFPGRKAYTLMLVQQSINSTDNFSFGVIQNNTRKKISSDPGLHYRGYVEGDPSSIACLSLFANGEIIGVFANQEGNFNIGKIKGTTAGYIAYKDSDMPSHPNYSCSTDELPLVLGSKDPIYLNREPLPEGILPSTLCNKVRFYWEGDYRLYSYNFGSNIVSTQNYLTGLFNIVAAIYENEGIIVELAKSYVWTTTDPYSNSTSSAALSSFKTRWNGMGNNFTGDLAHLVAGGTSNNGGVAYLLNADICNRTYTYGYSNVYGNYLSYPSYSWDVEVISHELGHNMGSHHTHWCGWNTGNGSACGAIDNCRTVESNGSCTTCSATTSIPPVPSGFKGTIMSYCHLVSGVGINIANGFGPLPQAAIRSTVTAGVCLTRGNLWTGAVNTAWETAGNWSCGTIPTALTDVTINSGLPRYPIVNSAAICRSIKQKPVTTLKVNTGSLKLMGPPN